MFVTLTRKDFFFFFLFLVLKTFFSYTLGGFDSEGVFPCILGHEGGGLDSFVFQFFSFSDFVFFLKELSSLLERA